jgi:hypothetical protein
MPQDPLAVGEPALAFRVGDRLELRPPQIGEQVEVAQPLGQILGHRPRSL